MREISLVSVSLLILALVFNFSSDKSHSNLTRKETRQIQLHFQQWASGFARTYLNGAEKNYRLMKFSQNYQFIEQHNERYRSGAQTFEVGLNQFADMDNSEFTQAYLKRVSAQTAAITQQCSGTVKILENLPHDQDWGSRAVSRPKNQGLCTGAWAFTAVGALEGLASLIKGTVYNFSAQQLIDCSSQYGNQGCNGGQIQNSFWYVIDNGITTQQKYPFANRQQQCNYTVPQKVFQNSRCAKVTPNNTKALASALVQQPTAVMVDSSSLGFQLYRRGIFSGRCGTNVNHAMLLTGYGALDNQDYWKLKNSWGLTWGQEGYMFLSKTNQQNGPGQCGILMKPSLPLE